MSMKIIYTGQLASIAGVSEEIVEVPAGMSLGTVVAAAVERLGSEFGALLCDEAGTLRPTILVAVDGAQATGDREAMPLDGVREVMFMAPVAGG